MCGFRSLLTFGCTNQIPTGKSLNKSSNAPDSAYVFQQLLNYRIIVETNDYNSRFILVLPYRQFLEYFYQESQPVNSAIIQGYISALQQRIDDLKKAYEEDSSVLILRNLTKLGVEPVVSDVATC